MGVQSIKSQTGQVVVIVVVCLTVLLGAIGLALDSGLGYMNKAKLNATVDAAAAAAVMGATQGANENEQIESGKAAAAKFFAANYPVGFLSSNKVISPETHIRFGNDATDRGVIYADVSAITTMPATFMKALGFESLQIKASAQTIRRDLDLVFVVDSTGSIDQNNNDVGMRVATKKFISQLSQNTDRVSLVGFGLGASALVPFKSGYSRGFDQDAMKRAIDDLVFLPHTNTGQGLWMALDQHRKLKANSSPSSLRVIVLFTDGWPSGFSSKFRFNPYSKCFPQHWTNTTKVDTTTTTTTITTTTVPGHFDNTYVGYEWINNYYGTPVLVWNGTITGQIWVDGTTTESFGTPQVVNTSTSTPSINDTQGPVGSNTSDSQRIDVFNSTTRNKVDTHIVTTYTAVQIPEPDPYIIGSLSLGAGVSGLEGYQNVNPAQLTPDCNGNGDMGEDIYVGGKHLLEYPEYYSAFPNTDNIPINSPRPVPLTGFVSMDDFGTRTGVYNASANVAEGIARKARQEGILILAVVLAPDKNASKVAYPWNDKHPTYSTVDTAKTVLGCIANTDSAESPNGCRNNNSSAEPTGTACYADTAVDGDSSFLDQCYTQVLNKILRFTK